MNNYHNKVRIAIRIVISIWVAMYSTTSFAQSLNKVYINTDWKLQKAPVIIEEARKGSWLKENSAKQTIEGSILSTLSYNVTEWYDATVPGTILTSLVNAGIYDEPLYAENNRPEIIPEDLNKIDWWYRKVFTVPSDYKNKIIWLNFDGINYEADIWVNGNRVAPMKGAFIRGKFDITSYVKPGEEAVIAVKISPQPHISTPSEHTMGTVGGPCGGVGRLDGPTFACSNGWDWLSGIRDRNSGIWDDVFLSATGAVLVKDPLITTDINLPDTTVAFVRLEAVLQNVTDNIQTGTVKAGFDDIVVQKEIRIPARTTMTVTFDRNEYPQLEVKNPRLWWPNGLGSPKLYTMSIDFTVNDVISDKKDVNFGIREISYHEEDSDILALSVNGVKIFCKGGNWGMDEALKRVSRDRLEAQIRMHRDTNFNMIRNWGGQSTSDELYELCDKYGMLLWDEFFQFNNADPIDLDVYMANVRDKVLRYRNHPSIVLWCARNEAYPPKYLDDAVAYLLAEIDPTRFYQSNSGGGHGCNSGGPYEWQTPADYYTFTEKRNFNKRETFKTEIGAMSVPTLESIQGMMPQKDWNSITDAWAEHNFASANGRKMPKMIAERYGAALNVADFVRKAQMMNYEGHRAMYEGRMGKMFKPMQGILLWMSIPAQPSFVWQMMHYDLEPNASMFGLQKACEQVHIQLNESDNGIVQVVNHLPTAINNAKCNVTIYNLDGTLVAKNEYIVNANGCSVTNIAPFTLPEGFNEIHFVKLELIDAKGKAVSNNFYWRGAADSTNDFRALDKMPKVKLSAKTKVRYESDKVLIDVELHNTSDNIALMTHLQLHRDKSLARVLPAYYSDNYISLTPDEKRVITIEASDKDFNGEKPLVLIDGWNVTVAKSKTVAPNKNADIASWGNSRFGFIMPEQTPQHTARINCAGYNRGDFKKDPGFLEGALTFCTESVDTTNVVGAGPELMYRTVRWGQSSYSFLMDGAAEQYKLRLHFAELDNNTPEGKRRFNVKVNGTVVARDIDVFKAAGGSFKAYIKEFHGITPDKDNKINIEFVNGSSGSPQINGIEIIPM